MAESPIVVITTVLSPAFSKSNSQIDRWTLRRNAVAMTTWRALCPRDWEAGSQEQLKEALEAHGDEDREVLQARAELGSALSRQGLTEDALDVLDSALGAALVALDEGDPLLWTLRLEEARCLIQSGDRERAEESVEEALENLSELLGDEAPLTRDAVRLRQTIADDERREQEAERGAERRGS